ncbi:hypothetical protein IPL85_01090 [Candidatus Saccharibacteria bacterium]|nr:MAG: hypothetical protein IPL85_01090 [Candidatus Saccharibacteria bacterium]
MKEEETKSVSAEPTSVGESKPSPKLPKKWLYVLFGLVLLGSMLFYGFILGARKGSAPAPYKQSQTNNTPDKSSSQTKPAPQDTAESAACASGLKRYADKSVGVTFCYPSSWGVATLADAKIGSGDTGSRQLIRFADNPFVSVGGASDDWSTTVGRGVGCLEPQNTMPALSSYNTDWHNISGSGMAVDYAERSLPSAVGGYSIIETVSSMIVEGVCVHGYKQINGSRYKVVSAAFYRDFAEASGITTPSAHMAEPTVLFSTQQRSDFDNLLASLESY